MNNIVKSFGPTAATLGGGFFVGVLIGYAVKKVIKIAAVIVGLFLAGLAYLQYHQIANINWNKLQTVSEGVLTTVANLTMQIPGTSITNIDGHAAAEWKFKDELLTNDIFVSEDKISLAWNDPKGYQQALVQTKPQVFKSAKTAADNVLSDVYLTG